MPLNYVTVTGTFDDGSGSPVTSGSPVFTPSAIVLSSGLAIVTPTTPVQASIVSGQLKNGSGGPLQLLATDNSGLTVAGLTGFWYWEVTGLPGQGTQSFGFFLKGSPATQDISSLINSAASGGGAALPLTTLGDTLYEDGTPAAARLPGNSSVTKKYLTQTGTGTVSAAPAWGTIAAGDVPTLNQDTTGKSAKTDALDSATTVVNVSAATAPNTGQVLTATDSTHAAWQSPASVDQPYQFRPENYGAKADGVMALVNTTAASAVINTTPLAAPSAPTLSNAGSGGSLVAGTYQVEVTYVNQWGETVASASSSQAISGTQPLTITSPAFSFNATGWYAYVTQAGGSTYFRQQTAGQPTPIGQNLVLTATPTTSGANPPGANTTAARVFNASTDVGKNIMICGGKGSPGGPTVDTIASVQSATQATISSSANVTATTTGAAMAFSTDDRVAIDNCITAAAAYAAANGNMCQILFGAKIYGLGTGLFQSLGNNGTAGLGYNTQVRIPVGQNSGYTNYFEPHFLGAGDATDINFWMSALPGATGTVLMSYSVGPTTADATFGQQSVLGGPSTGNSNFSGGSNGFFNCHAVVKGIQVIQPGFSNSIGMDFQWLGGVTLRGTSTAFAPRWNTNAAAVNPSNAWPGNTFWKTFVIDAGVRLPNESNNADNQIESFAHVGLRYGVLTQGDHVIIGRLGSYNFDQGVFFTSGNSADHDVFIGQWHYLGTSSNGTALRADSVGAGSHIAVNITMDGENAAGTIGNDVYDPNSVFYGIIRWGDTERSPGVPTVVGAANVTLLNDRLGPGHMGSPPAVPTTTVAASLVYRPAFVSIHTGAGVTVSFITIDGTPTGQTIAASSSATVRVPAGKTIALTYAGGTPTWDWWLD